MCKMLKKKSKFSELSRKSSEAKTKTYVHQAVEEKYYYLPIIVDTKTAATEPEFEEVIRIQRTPIPELGNVSERPFISIKSYSSVPGHDTTSR